MCRGHKILPVNIMHKVVWDFVHNIYWHRIASDFCLSKKCLIHIVIEYYLPYFTLEGFFIKDSTRFIDTIVSKKIESNYSNSSDKRRKNYNRKCLLCIQTTSSLKWNHLFTSSSSLALFVINFFRLKETVRP